MKEFSKVSCCFGLRCHKLQVYLEPKAGLCLAVGMELLEGQPGHSKSKTWTDSSVINILVSCFWICPFQLPFDRISSFKPVWVTEYIWKGLGGPNALVFATDLKSPLNRKIEILSEMEMLLKRRSLVLLVFISPPSEMVAKYCRKWCVYKMNGSVPSNTCRRGN